MNYDENMSLFQKETKDEADRIEEEIQGNEPISVPFDPNLIRIRRDPFTLGELIDKIEYNEVNFKTSFQRKSDLWDATKQSRLIESVLLRLPLPAFYFDEVIENEDDIENRRSVWQVIDGLQRCSAFNHFIVKKDLALENLEFLTRFNGMKYDDLPRELQRRIQQTPITTYIVEKGTPEEVKFNIFKRINTGGLVLTAQEIRHAMNQGIAADFVAELAAMPSFQQATCYIISQERMEDRDFITRFVSFYLQDYKTYLPDLDSFLTKGMSQIKYITQEQRDKMKQDFEEAMIAAYKIFGNDAFRKRTDITARRKPLNKALFEVLSVLLSRLSSNEREWLISKGELFKEKFRKLNCDNAFRYSISSGTGQRDSVIRRYTEINRVITETLEQ
ncbi:DUF262 domain-containing protein [Bacteroides acidifaciens]|uniref:DUF262 domain-containing protein n=1 Tax=Bacteroides acidifaciens TaxID=85831 RepID=UPI0025581C93|nr:DUF262 domain-containing protein [Bacteroides acidifaciens]